VESLGRLVENHENVSMSWTDLVLVLAATKGLDDVLIVKSALERNAYAEDDAIKNHTGTPVHEVVRRVLIRSTSSSTVKVVMDKVCRCADGGCVIVFMNAAKFWFENSSDVSSDLATNILSYMFQIFPGCRYEILRTIFDAFDEQSTTSVLLQQQQQQQNDPLHWRRKGFYTKHVQNSHFNVLQFRSLKLLSNLCGNVETARHLGTAPLISCLSEWSTHLYLYGTVIALSLSRALLPLVRLSSQYRQSVAISYRKNISSAVMEKRIHAVNGLCLILSSSKQVFTSRAEYEDCALCLSNALRFPNNLRREFYESVVAASNSSCAFSKLSQQKSSNQSTTTSSRNIVPNFPMGGSSIHLTARKILFKSMFTRLERFFFMPNSSSSSSSNNKEQTTELDIRRCFELSKNCVREREPLCTLLLACSSIVVPAHRKRLEILCTSLARQLLNPSKVLELMRMEQRSSSSSTTTTKSKKKKSSSSSSETMTDTFMGGLNGKQILETCPNELIDVEKRATLVLPLHTAAAVSLFATFKAVETPSAYLKNALTLLEQQIVLESLIDVDTKKRGRKHSHKKRKTDELLEIDSSSFVTMPYGT